MPYQYAAFSETRKHNIDAMRAIGAGSIFSSRQQAHARSCFYYFGLLHALTHASYYATFYRRRPATPQNAPSLSAVMLSLLARRGGENNITLPGTRR